MRKRFLFSVRFVFSFAFGILAACFADRLIHYDFAFASAFFFAAVSAFYLLEVSFDKIFKL